MVIPTQIHVATCTAHKECTLITEWIPTRKPQYPRNWHLQGKFPAEIIAGAFDSVQKLHWNHTWASETSSHTEITADGIPRASNTGSSTILQHPGALGCGCVLVPEVRAPVPPSIGSRCCGSGRSCPRCAATRPGAPASWGPSSASASWTSTSPPSWRTWRRSCTDSPRNEARPALPGVHTALVIKG